MQAGIRRHASYETETMRSTQARSGKAAMKPPSARNPHLATGLPHAGFKQPAYRLPFFGASIVRRQVSAPQWQTYACFSALVWRCSTTKP